MRMTCEFVTNDRGMKLIAVMIASLSLITTPWAQGGYTKNGGNRNRCQH